MDHVDLRCSSKKHGELMEGGSHLEVKCNSRFCGAGGGVIVLHTFDTRTGELVDTKQYRDVKE